MQHYHYSDGNYDDSFDGTFDDDECYFGEKTFRSAAVFTLMIMTLMIIKNDDSDECNDDNDNKCVLEQQG